MEATHERWTEGPVNLITTVDRVRDPMDSTTSHLTNSILEDFLADQQAFLER